MEPGYQRPSGIVAGIDIALLVEIIDAEFHFFCDVLFIDEDKLDSEWLLHILQLIYPHLTDSERNQIISHIGWH